MSFAYLYSAKAGTAHVGLVAWAALKRIVDGSGSEEELGTLAARISHMRAVAARGVAAVDCEEPIAYLDSEAIAISKSLGIFRPLRRSFLSETGKNGRNSKNHHRNNEKALEIIKTLQLKTCRSLFLVHNSSHASNTGLLAKTKLKEFYEH